MNRHDKRVAELFADAINYEPDERSAFLARACQGQPLLLAEVEALLAADEEVEAAGFLREPALNLQASHFACELEESRLGQRLGHYEIVSLIGEGGMGEVYLARDLEFDRRVALKLVKAGLKTKAVLRRFHNERQILANLQHPNIARLLDGGTSEDGLPYFVMEYVEGEPITEYADAHKLTLRERLKLFCTVCSAVQFAHQNLVIHRDIKPSNILVTEDGTPKLLDFGIAKLFDPTLTSDAPEATATMLRVMTPEYASPEQAKGEPITTASDVYSLGVLLYELLTGHRPYRVKSHKAEEVVKAICEQLPEKPSTSAKVSRPRTSGPKADLPPEVYSPKALRGDLDNIVLMALRKEPQRRYSSVSEFAEDIHRHLTGLPVRARKDTFGYRASKFVQRNKGVVAAAAIVLMVLIGGIIATNRKADVARLQRTRAEHRFNEVRELAHSVLFNYHDAIASLPGSTPVRESLVKDALKYLDELASDEDDSPSLQRELAAAYLKVGDVQGQPYASNLGQTDGALASYRKAATILEPLSASDPSDTSITRELATAYERIGNIELRLGDWSAALDQNNKALAMRQVLLATDQSNKSYRSEVADSYLYVGDAIQVKCQDVECLQRALDYQQRALAIRETLAKEDPSERQYRRGVAQAYTRIGFRLNALGNISKNQAFVRQWLDSERASLTITRELTASDPTNSLDRRKLADQLMLTGNAEMENGDLAQALNLYRDSLEIFKGLASADPTNAEALRDMVFIYFRLAAALSKTGDLRAAKDNYTAALRISEQLLAEDPTNFEETQSEAGIYKALIELSQKAGDLPGAIENYRKAAEMFKKMAAVVSGSSSPYQLSYSLEEGICYRDLGSTLGATGDRAAAFASFHQAEEVFTDLMAKNPNDVNVGCSWANLDLAISRLKLQAKDLNGALDSALQGIKLDEAVLTTLPSYLYGQHTLARLYAQVGASQAALAARAGTSEKADHWHAAKEAYQKSLVIFRDLKSKGFLHGADIKEPEAAARAMAKCDIRLTKRHGE